MKLSKIIFAGFLSIVFFIGCNPAQASAPKVTNIKGVLNYFNHHGLKSKDNHNWEIFGNIGVAKMVGAVNGVPLTINGKKKYQVEIFQYKNERTLKGSLKKYKKELDKSVIFVTNGKFIMNVPKKDPQKAKITKVFKAMKTK